MRARPIFFVALAVAVGVYAVSRTRRGGELVALGLELADSAGRTVVSAAKSLRYGYAINNPGNIRWIADGTKRWNGMVNNDHGYAKFDTAANGTRALGKQLLKYEREGLRTVRQIVSKWAPSSENDTAAYVAHVAQQLGVNADAPLNVAGLLPQLAKAMARHENGYVDSSYDWNWVNLP